MSIQVITSNNRGRSDIGAPSEAFERFEFRSTSGDGSPQPDTYRFHRTKTASSGSARKLKQVVKVKRRLKGFLVEMETKEARVAFVENNEVFQYDMPAEQLRAAGIKVRNQPFQMDEIEMELESGMVIGYRFTALADESDAYHEALDVDAERKRKRDFILKEFGKPQS